MAKLEGVSLEPPRYLCRWLYGVRCIGSNKIHGAMSETRKTGDTVLSRGSHFLMYKPLVEWDE